MRFAIFARLRFLRSITQTIFFKYLFPLWGLLGAWDLGMSQLVPKEYSDKIPKFSEVVQMTTGLLSWQTWAVVGSVIVAIAAIEASFRNSDATLAKRHAAEELTNGNTMTPLIGMIIFGAGFLVCLTWFLLSKGDVSPQIVEMEKFTTNDPPQQGFIPARGGNASAEGKSNVAIAGRAGESGIVAGGPGGDAHARGEGNTVIGGDGGGAPQADGRGGRGGVAGRGAGYNVILDNGHRLSDYGRGGDGGHTLEYVAKHWLHLNIDEIIVAFNALRFEPSSAVTIVCADESGVELAQSLVDLFERLRWQPIVFKDGNLGMSKSLEITPQNIATTKIAEAIMTATNGRLKLNQRSTVKHERGIVISIGPKPN